MSLSFYSTILVVLIYSPSFFLFIKYNIIDEIENNLEHISDSEKKFLSDFIEWLKEALKHTTIIVVEGNL